MKLSEMKHIQCEQGSPEWHAARLGKVTGSRISDVTAKGKSGSPSASRANYRAQLVAERLTGELAESFKSASMEWGNEKEAEAAEMYAFQTGYDLERCGLVIHPTIDLAGASPDRIVGDEGLVQIKCPNTATHIATCLGASIDGGYLKQMQWEMACTGRLWCDFASFDPRLPADMRLKVIRVPRDSAAIVAIQSEVQIFLDEVADEMAALIEVFRGLEAAA